MKNEKKDRIIFMTIITGRKQKDALLSALTQSGVRLINTVYGKGTVKASFLQNTLGLVPERNKAVVTCVMTSSRSDAVLEMLIKKFDFDKPNTGIAFAVPIDRLSF